MHHDKVYSNTCNLLKMKLSFDILVHFLFILLMFIYFLNGIFVLKRASKL